MARSKLNPNQVMEDTLEDADGNTKVHVEKASDENKIRFDTAGTERMIIDADGKIGIGTTSPDHLLTLNAAADGDGCFIQYKEEEADRAKIGINTSNNLLIQNQFTNKHIVFKVNDQGTTREGLRIDGAVPEVVVNEGSESLVDFRVESNSNTHMVFVDGGNNTVGINTSTPKSTFSVNGSLALSVLNINAAVDPGTTYTVTSTDCVILVNTRQTAQGGIDSAITLTLPDASDNPGMVITVKDAGGYADQNNITVSSAGSDTIEGIGTTLVLNNIAQKTTLISDGVSNWSEIGN